MYYHVEVQLTVDESNKKTYEIITDTSYYTVIPSATIERTIWEIKPDQPIAL